MRRPPSLLERYDAGDRRAVWDELHAIGAIETLDPARRDDVLAVVEATIGRAESNVRTIHARLVSLGFVFEYPGDNRFGEIDSGLEATMALFAEIGPLPPAIARFCARIGTVCLRGWLPSAGTEDEWKARFLDPLEILPSYDVEGSNVIPSLCQSTRAKNDYFKEYAPTRLSVPAPGVDALVREAESAEPVWFVDYLRAYFVAGGFRTVAATQQTPGEFVRFLATDLLEI